jgi:TonB family protein
MVCPTCKASVPNDYAYCLNCGQYLGEPTLVRPSPALPPSSIRVPPESFSDKAVPRATTSRLPWLIAGASLAGLFIVLLLLALHFPFKNDQVTQQQTGAATPLPGAVISQASVTPEVAASPSLVPTQQERHQPSEAPLPSPESTTPPRGGETDYNKIFSGKDVTSKARVLSKPEPQYTEEARTNQVAGTVVLRAVFTSGGQVTNVRAVSGLPYGLTERAIAAARNIKFVPATKDGRSVSMYIQLEYNFNLY